MHSLIKKTIINVSAIVLLGSCNLIAMEQQAPTQENVGVTVNLLLEELNKIQNHLDSDALLFENELAEYRKKIKEKLESPIKNFLQSLTQLWSYRLGRLNSIKFKHHVMPTKQFIGFMNKNGITVIELRTQDNTNDPEALENACSKSLHQIIDVQEKNLALQFHEASKVLVPLLPSHVAQELAQALLAQRDPKIENIRANFPENISYQNMQGLKSYLQQICDSIPLAAVNALKQYYPDITDSLNHDCKG